MKKLSDRHLYDHAVVRLKFRERVYGGIPKTKQLIDNYVSSKFGIENGDLADELKKEMDLIEETEKITTGFKKHNGRPYISDYQIKALIRQAATRLKITTKKRGSKQDITDGFFTDVRIFLTEQPCDKLPIEDFCGHVQTPRGKRSILKASEYVERAEVCFHVRRITTAILSKTDILECFLLGQEIGLGSNRSFEKGKYDLLSLKWEKKKDHKK